MRRLPKKKKKGKNISSSAYFSSKSQWTFPCKYKNKEFSLGNTKKSSIKIEFMGCLFPCFLSPKRFCVFWGFFWAWFCVLCFCASLQFWIIYSNGIPQSLFHRDQVIVGQCVSLGYT